MIKLTKMKNEQQSPLDYIPPRVEILEINVESGFATSPGKFEDGGSLFD